MFWEKLGLLNLSMVVEWSKSKREIKMPQFETAPHQFFFHFLVTANQMLYKIVWIEIIEIANGGIRMIWSKRRSGENKKRMLACTDYNVRNY